MINDLERIRDRSGKSQLVEERKGKVGETYCSWKIIIGNDLLLVLLVWHVVKCDVSVTLLFQTVKSRFVLIKILLETVA